MPTALQARPYMPPCRISVSFLKGAFSASLQSYYRMIQHCILVTACQCATWIPSSMVMVGGYISWAIVARMGLTGSSPVRWGQVRERDGTRQPSWCWAIFPFTTISMDYLLLDYMGLTSPSS